MKKLSDLFFRLRILKFAPKENWEWEIYFDEFRDVDLKIFEKVCDYIMKNYEEFPRPAVFWKIYNELISRQLKKNTFYCHKCGNFYSHKGDKFVCPACKVELKPSEIRFF